VAAVVLYHAGVAPAAGYVGVDIFFVISGYLISSVLITERENTGSIDLWNFYARRVRRILPALTVVILATLALAHVLLSASSAAAMAPSAAAAGVFVANLYFQAQTGGYWGADASQMPLLHLWSLSVEEQFYLLWPALVMLATRVRPRTAFVPIAIASFALAEWWLQAGVPEAAFYQMPARCWELAAGALVATLPARALPAWCGPAGLYLTLAACFVPIAHFPATGALPAVAGSALLLAAIHGGARNRVLASAPMVGLGLVSYSLYLWHWPLLALDRLLRVGPSPPSMRLLLVAIALVLAIATYRYVETPFRQRRLPSGRTVAAGAAAMMVLSCSAWAWHAPIDAPLTASQTAAADHSPNRICNYLPLESVDVFPQASCAPTHAAVVTWGDSMAHAWQPYAETLGAPLIGFSRAGCPPLLGVTIRDQARVQGRLCERFNAKVADWIVAHRPGTVVIGERWSHHVDAEDEAGLRLSIARIAPSVDRIIVFGPSPQLPESLPKCMDLGADCGVARTEVDATNREATAMLARLDALPKVEVVDVLPFLCSATRCPGIRGGVPLYSDTIHVSARAARAFAFTDRTRSPAATSGSTPLISSPPRGR
jgi:peptidoglycan/LPS O-acetylase OafA/YrhL